MVKKNVAIIFGGVSVEHEISIISANSILNNIDKKKFNPIGIYISKKGILQHCKIIKKEKKLKFKPYESSISVTPGLKKVFLLNGERPLKVDIIFPIIHGTTGEDGAIQGFIKILNIASVGSDVLSSSLTMNKILSKDIIAKNNIKTCKYLIVNERSLDNDIKKIKKEIGTPCFVKTSNLGSSIGIYKINNFNNIKKYIKKAFKFSNEVFVEEAVIKAQEIEVSVFGYKDDIFVSTPGEIRPSSEFYDYNAKYIDNKSELIIPATICDKNKSLEKKIKNNAKKIFKELKCEGMARIDFLYGKTKKSNIKDLFFSEVNSIPGFTDISMFPKLINYSGITYRNLITKLINISLKKFKDEKKFIKFFTN
tara:strand:- start:248 stop:1345 length:1098 start_codon:yes stop_codon:yes gene_type:complete